MNYAREDQGEFAELIALWRRARGLSQEALGAAIHLSQRHISFIENGRTRPSAAVLLRVIKALAVSAADGNRLLNLLGYRAALTTRDLDQPIVAPPFLAFAETLMGGLERLPAAVISDLFAVQMMTPVQAMWWSHVAQFPEVFANGFLSYHRAIFHPKGMRRCTENWEEFAVAYLQVILRERLRNPEAGDRILHEIIALAPLPDAWLEMNVDAPSLSSIVLHQRTPLGVVNLSYAAFSIAQPRSQQLESSPELIITYLQPADESSSTIIEVLHQRTRAEDVHERLRSAVCGHWVLGTVSRPSSDDAPIKVPATNKLSPRGIGPRFSSAPTKTARRA